MLVPIQRRLSLALCSAAQARNLMLGSSRPTKFVSMFDEYERPTSAMGRTFLIEMYEFSRTLNEKIRSNIGKDLIACVENTCYCITRAALLLGSYLILQEDLSVEEVERVFLPLRNRISDFKEPSCIGAAFETLTISDCLNALHTAKQANWIDFRLGPDVMDAIPMLDMDEYAHYASPVNGSLYLAVPPKFIQFQCPVDLPASRRWMDVEGSRYFSPSFYADLLAFLGVRLVVRTEPCDYDAAPFRARGIEIEDLTSGEPGSIAAATSGLADPPSSCPDDADSDLLRTADRIRTLACATDGLIAIHGGLAPSAAQGAAAAALASYLIACHGFPGKAAVAWLRMAAPALSPPALMTDQRSRDAVDDDSDSEAPAAGSHCSTLRCRRSPLMPLRLETDGGLRCDSTATPVSFGEAATRNSSGRRARPAASAPATPSGPLSPARPLPVGAADRALQGVRRALWH